MTTITKNYDPSPAHAKRAKLGEFVGQLSYGHRRAGGPDTVDHASWTITKVYDDGAIRVTDTQGRNKTLKPDGKRGSRFIWYYTETQPYRSNVLCAIQTKKDREKRDADNDQYERERRAKERAHKRQHERNQPLYDKLVQFAEARGLLVKSASMGEVEIGPREYANQTHADLDILLPSWDVKLDLACSGIQVPIEMFLSLANITD